MEIETEILVHPETGARRMLAEYGDRLYDAACRLCLDEELAKDLVSRTLVRAIERISLFRGNSTFYTWLYSILFNFWRMERRTQRTERVTYTDDLPDLPDESPNPAERLAAEADAAAIREAVAALPAHYRAVTVSRYFEDMSVPEIAWALGLPEGTVKFRLHKAKRLMRRHLAQTIGAQVASNGNGDNRQ
ncbi:MAG: sigma-70 family RNA polymerase sigma factor [Kiritimatiellae bacterium]|nr:sigma-70 family RNA polymerase sigma factor [Kiritimatiellia bacterium]